MANGSMPKMTAEGKAWMAKNDCMTLAAAEEIKADSNRMSAAQKAASAMATEAKQKADAMSKIAGNNAKKSEAKKPAKVSKK